VPRRVTLDVDGHGHAGDVAGKGLRVDGQRRGQAAKALRSYADAVHPLKDLGFQGGEAGS